ncbi:biofilm regulation protein phosphatase SiaA [Chitinimonas sp. BJYL2]|uniref:biofilm regulation protein phosphatase SiaA n=1 Tax=Chitinimonas sp. BJYL2 TaxID=2976696 RepID=UPI0022B38554|nr:biofilm regulation protein phosphatase SiaA [Chitinimonas sp. BJYL2]
MLLSRLGLRGKALIALAIACILALLPALLIGWRVVDNIRNHFGVAYARDTALLSRERVFAPLSRELALSLRFADSEITRQWLLDETNPAKRELMFREAEGYRRDFRDRSYFIISNQSHQYYFNDAFTPLSQAPRYRLDAAKAEDGWYFSTLKNTQRYNINVNYDASLKVTKAWINVMVYDGERKIGLAGTGFDLSTFLGEFIRNHAVGVTPIIIDAKGAIQAHPDERLIALNSGTQSATHTGGNLLTMLPDASTRAALLKAMKVAEASRDAVGLAHARLDGKSQVIAVSHIPELRWYVVSAVDLHAARLFEDAWIKPVLAGVVLVLFLLLAGFIYAVERLILGPLKRLRASAQAMAEGDYQVGGASQRDDEIGELSRAFAGMADQVRSHTEQLEARVQERTAALEAANREMAAAHKKINDSIDYASLIQRAILPDRQLTQSLGEHHFVLWRPRDVVGGDFYVFREDGDNCLLGVIDCAGHGVPGALMTMLARAAIDHAIAEVGTTSPAAILHHTDAAMRQMLSESHLPRSIATSMDAGLVYVDRAKKTLRFAGAKIALLWSDGETVEEIKGDRRAIGDKRRGDYQDVTVPLQANRTYYLTTDGLLDQAGGEHGFGFGTSRLVALVREHAALPLAEQGAALAAAVARHQGDANQRDDITLLCFRFD